MNRVVLSKKASAGIKEGFLWAYKNEVISTLENGLSAAEIYDDKGEFLAVGYYNPASVIAVRIFDRKRSTLGRDFFRQSLLKAIKRRSLLNAEAYRIVNSESDLLPGLVVDRYKDYIRIDFTTAGMLMFKDDILSLLFEILKPGGAVVDFDERLQKKEGVEFEREILGEVPKKILFKENSIVFAADIIDGQKSGFYLDQRRNRRILSEYIAPRSEFLDLFCNTGGFGLYAAKKKDARVTAVDISQKAIEDAKENYEINGCGAEFVRENVFDYLRVLRKEKRRFNVIVVDPPSFAKNSAQKRAALRGFWDLTVNSFKLAAKEAFVALFSCSYHVEEKDLLQIANRAALQTNRKVSVLDTFYQDIDHPWILGFDYSKYLKGFLFRLE